MERIEGNHSRPVHVLRHIFEPTPKLLPEVKKFLIPSAREEKFRFVATKLAILDGVNFASSRYDDDIRAAAKSFEAARNQLLLTGRVSIHEMQKTTRIGLQLKDQIAFNRLLAGFNELDSLRPDGYTPEHPNARPVKHYIYTEVPTSALIEDHDELAEAVYRFKHTVRSLGTQSLYSFRPLKVTGQDYTIVYNEAEEKIAAKARKIDPWLQDDIAS